MHGVRGASGGVPARGPGFSPDLFPHARPSAHSSRPLTHLSPVVCHIQTARWETNHNLVGRPARCLTLFIQGLAFLAFGLNLVYLDAPSIGVAILEPVLMPRIACRGVPHPDCAVWETNHNSVRGPPDASPTPHPRARKLGRRAGRRPRGRRRGRGRAAGTAAAAGVHGAKVRDGPARDEGDGGGGARAGGVGAAGGRAGGRGGGGGGE